MKRQVDWDAFDQNKTVTSQDIHAMSNHQGKTESNDMVIKSCNLCDKCHKIKQCPAKVKLLIHVTKQAI